jgi:hypothetical protein
MSRIGFVPAHTDDGGLGGRLSLYQEGRLNAAHAGACGGFGSEGLVGLGEGILDALIRDFVCSCLSAAMVFSYLRTEGEIFTLKIPGLASVILGRIE